VINNDDVLQQFGLLYEKHAPGLIFYARKFVSEFVAEDIVHDVFLNIWKEKSFFIIEETILNYLFRSVRNACLNYLKHQTINQDFITAQTAELSIIELNASSIEDLIIEKEQMEAIYAAIKLLPEKCGTVFRLSFFENKKNGEIAGILNISTRTVEAHLYKALTLLRNKLIILSALLIIF